MPSGMSAAGLAPGGRLGAESPAREGLRGVAMRGSWVQGARLLAEDRLNLLAERAGLEGLRKVVVAAERGAAL